MDEIENSAEAVKVIIRCRPMSEKEINRGCKKCIKILHDQNSVIVEKPEDPTTTKQFTFDAVFDDDSKQEEVYEKSARGIVDSVIEGFNGTVFAYGQTGSGKTFSVSSFF